MIVAAHLIAVNEVMVEVIQLQVTLTHSVSTNNHQVTNDDRKNPLMSQKLAETAIQVVDKYGNVGSILPPTIIDKPKQLGICLI